MSDENQYITSTEDKISFRNNDHGNVLCEIMYNEQIFCDVILKADLSNKKIHAHRSVLSSQSKYFKNIFTSRTQLGDQPELIINNISEEMLRKIIEYCYTGRLELENNKTRLDELLNKARFFQMKFLVETCMKWMIKHALLSPLALYRFYSIEKYSEELKETLFGEICDNFMQIYRSEDFLKLSVDELTKLIGQDNIKVKSEQNVLDAVLAWLNYNFNEREQHIGRLLPLIRFPFLQPTYISNHLKTICRSNKNMILMLEALEWHNVPENRAKLDWICTKERRFGSLVIIIGHGAPTDSAKFFEIYDPILNKSAHYDIMPQERSYCQQIAATTMDNELIVAGGCEKNLILNTVYKLNLATMTWSQLPSMLKARKLFKIIVLQDRIFAVGGEPTTNTVECWDPNTIAWKFVSGMSTERSEHSVIELNNKIYALGGWDGNGIISSVESYDANLDKWTTKASMNKRRHNFSVGILNDFLYAIGGYVEKSVERYDAKADKWILLYTFDNNFSWLTCISQYNCFMGTAYYDDTTNIVKYDTETNEITTLHMLKYRRWGHEVLAIPFITLRQFQ